MFVFLLSYYSIRPLICCESHLPRSGGVSIIAETEDSFFLAEKIAKRGYNVTLGISRNPNFLITSDISCPANYQRTDVFMDLLPASFLSSSFFRKIVHEYMIPILIVFLVIVFLEVVNFWIVNEKNYQIGVKINVLPFKKYTQGVYKTERNEGDEITIFRHFKVRFFKFLSMHFSWQEKQGISNIDAFNGISACVFRTDEMLEEKFFTLKTSIENGLPLLSFNIDEMKINAYPTEYPFTDFMPVNEVLRLFFAGIGAFHNAKSVDDFDVITESIVKACDMSGSAIGWINRDNVKILSMKCKSKEVEVLIRDYFEKFKEIKEHEIPVIANTIGQYRIWGAAITLGLKSYVVVNVRHNKTTVIRGPEFATTQMEALMYCVLISLYERDSSVSIEKVINIHNAAMSERKGKIINLVKNGYLIPFDSKTDFAKPPFKLENEAIVTIIKKKKSCIVNPGSNKEKFFVIHFPSEELSGFISFIKDDTAKAPIIHIKNMSFMGWLVRVDTLEVVWYLSSSAKTIRDVIDIVHDDDKQAFSAAVEHTRQYRQVDMAIVAHIKVDNVYKKCRVLLFRTSDDYFVITANDEEKINKRIDELRDLEHTVSLALASGNVILWNYEDTSVPSRIFLNWNDTKPLCFANRTTIESNIPMEFQQTVFDLFKRCMDTGEAFIYIVPVLIGTIKWCSISGIRTGPNSLQLLVIDITQTKDMEECLIIEKKRVEEAANAKTRFLANMSHEIRNPLNGISGLIELLCDTKLPNTNDKSIEILTTSFGKLLDLLNDTLDLAKIEQKKMKPSLTNFNPLIELSEVIKRSKKPSVPVITKTEPTLPILVHGDPHFFQRIASNLLSNAIKFTHDGFIRINTSSDGDNLFKLEVEDTGIGMSEEDQQQLFGIFIMGDSSIRRPYGGIGVGLALCTKMLSLLGGRMELKSVVGKGSIFTVYFPFPCIYMPYCPSTLRAKKYQILEITGNDKLEEALIPHCKFYEMSIIHDPALATSKLAAIFVYPDEQQIATARQIVKKFPDAKIMAFCEKGSEVFAPDIKTMIKPVPVTTLVGLFREIAWRKQHTEKSQNLGPIRVLLAEDNTTNQLVMRKMFQKLKIDGKIVENGREAINALEESNYDVLFLDEYMPVLDGPSAAREIRKNEKYKDLTIIALTASHGKDDETECLSAGMNAFLTKPITIKMMRDVLIKCASGQISANTKMPL